MSIKTNFLLLYNKMKASIVCSVPPIFHLRLRFHSTTSERGRPLCSEISVNIVSLLCVFGSWFACVSSSDFFEPAIKIWIGKKEQLLLEIKMQQPSLYDVAVCSEELQFVVQSISLFYFLFKMVLYAHFLCCWMWLLVRSGWCGWVVMYTI